MHSCVCLCCNLNDSINFGRARTRPWIILIPQNNEELLSSPPSYLSPLGSGPSISPLRAQAGRVIHIPTDQVQGRGWGW